MSEEISSDIGISVIFAVVLFFASILITQVFNLGEILNSSVGQSLFSKVIG